MSTPTVETFAFQGRNVPVIGRGELFQSQAGILGWRLVINAGMENSTAYTFVREDDGTVLRHGVCADFKARMKTFVVRPGVKLYSDLLPYVGPVVALATVPNDRGGSNDALRASLVAALPAPGNVKPRSALALALDALQHMPAMPVADFGDDGDLPDAAVTAAGVVAMLAADDVSADAPAPAKVRKARGKRATS